MDRASFQRQIVRGFDTPPDMADGGVAPGGVSNVHVLTLEDLHPEYRYLRNERLCGHTAFDPLDAANFSHGFLRNPTGSGALIMTREIIISNATAATVTYQIRAGTGITPDTESQGAMRDIRWGPAANARSTGLAGVRTQAAVVTGGLYAFVSVPAGAQYVYSEPFVLPPGAFVAVAGSAINLGVQVSFAWVERAAEDAELSGTGS